MPGVCAVCKVDVFDPIKHYSSHSHLENAARWERRPTALDGTTMKLGL